MNEQKGSYEDIEQSSDYRGGRPGRRDFPRTIFRLRTAKARLNLLAFAHANFRTLLFD
jgi:hypothetical protein